MKPVKYSYPAILGFDEPTGRYYVLWPDLPGCTTTGDTEEEALCCAREAMSLHMYGLEEDNEGIPASSPVIGLACDKNEAVVIIEAWMPSFREKMEIKAINRTVTLPGWLDREAKTANLNYSQILQDGIMQRLHISRAVEKSRRKKMSA
jgi:predicted RNase H-like HicB family nuclease